MVPDRLRQVLTSLDVRIHLEGDLSGTDPHSLPGRSILGRSLTIGLAVGQFGLRCVVLPCTVTGVAAVGAARGRSGLVTTTASLTPRQNEQQGEEDSQNMSPINKTHTTRFDGDQ